MSALVPGRLAPVVITEDMVKTMKRGSVIVDIAIEDGAAATAANKISATKTIEVPRDWLRPPRPGDLLENYRS